MHHSATVRTALCPCLRVCHWPLSAEEHRTSQALADCESVLLVQAGQILGRYSAAQLAQLLHENQQPESQTVVMPWVSADTTLLEAEATFRNRDIELLVVQADEVPLGVVTRTSLLRGLAQENTELQTGEHATSDGKMDPGMQRLIDALPFFVGLSDREGRIKFINRSMREAIHAESSDLLGKNLSQTYWFNGSSETQSELQRAAQLAALGQSVRLDLQVRIGEHDGVTEYVWIDAMIAPLFNTQGEVQELVGSAVDITKRRAFEDQARLLGDELAHALRLSTLGEMATGIAHELNQPLTAITNYAFVARQHLKHLPTEFAALDECLDQIQQQAIRSGGIIRGLKNLVRKAPAHRSTVDLNALIQSVVDLMTTELRMERIELNWQSSPGLPLMLVDTVQIQQVLLNLLRNSIEALRSRSENRQISLTTQFLSPDRIEVRVQDNGPGIPEWIRVSLFAPFTTSKVEGLGLGLVISRRIIEAHDGELKCETSSTAGTSFLFTLPVSPSEPLANAH